MDASDFQVVAFDEIKAIHKYTRDTGRVDPNVLPFGRLPYDLKVLHFYLTRVFLPCSYGHATIHPTDLWILASAKENHAISYPRLMFGHMVTYYDDNYKGDLPFSPQITLLLQALGGDLRYKVYRVDLIDRLLSQFVLRKVDASVGRRRPRVNAPRGERVANVVPPLEDGLSLTYLVDDDTTSSSGVRKVPADDKEADDNDEEDVGHLRLYALPNLSVLKSCY
ncbi:unnamed protein product [Linum trigynum]|uniref:Uncharacterized protein n=1 Tax=Linum trigynum TaxID=586398 RepID=A0AAV2EBW2_9ROSI